LRFDPKLASSLCGRGLAKLKKSNATAGGADIAAAKAIEANIVGDFARYGLPQRRVVDPLRVTVTRSESRPVLNELVTFLSLMDDPAVPVALGQEW
jgi:hypothetical protein